MPTACVTARYRGSASPANRVSHGWPPQLGPRHRHDGRRQDRISAAKDPALANLPPHGFHQNRSPAPRSHSLHQRRHRRVGTATARKPRPSSDAAGTGRPPTWLLSTPNQPIQYESANPNPLSRPRKTRLNELRNFIIFEWPDGGREGNATKPTHRRRS